MNTTSVRGTITSRTIVSPSSKTEWIISRSPDSMTLLASARSTISRSSASEANGPSLNPRPGVIALPKTMSTCATGPKTLVSSMTGAAENSATRSACCRPTVRGATPMSTNDTTVMTTTDAATAHHRPTTSSDTGSRLTIRSVISTVASTIAPISASRRRNSAVFM
jgi:hypothetical protein